MDAWKKKADSFAQYYGICFLPMPNFHGNQKEFRGDINWDWFCSTIEKMERSSLPIHKMRLQAMGRHIYGFQSNYFNRQIFQNHRHRASTKWSDLERKEARQVFGCVNSHKRWLLDMDEDEGQEETKMYSTSRIKRIYCDIGFAEQQKKTIHTLFGNTSGDAIGNPAQDSAQMDVVDTSPNTILQFDSTAGTNTQETARKIKVAKLPQTKKAHASHITTNTFGLEFQRRQLKRTRDGLLVSLKERAQQFIQQKDFKPGQVRIVRDMADYFIQLGSGQALQQLSSTTAHFLLTGDPGTGKSYVIDAITELATILKIGHVAACSYNGIAAVNIDGSTLCSSFAIHDDGGNKFLLLEEDTLNEIRLKLDVDNLKCLIVDEVSTIDARTLALLDFRLQQILDNFEAPFGGLAILLVGDFNQLGPVQKTFIPKDMMAWARRLRDLPKKGSGSPSSMFVDARTKASQSPSIPSSSKAKTIGKSFSSFVQQLKKTQGKSQTQKEEEAADRFSIDSLPYHGCSLLSRFQHYHLTEQVRAASDNEHNAFVQKLSRGKAIEIADILRYKTLTRDDISDAPHEWKYAPVLVSTNAERLSISRAKAILWAKQHGTYVLKWRCKITKHINRPMSTQFADALDENAFFWQFWVPGVPINLSANINCELALANGTPAVAHSLTFSDWKEHSRIFDLINGPNPPPPGTEIEVDLPVAVSVKIQESLDDKPLSTRRRQQLEALKAFSIVQNNNNQSTDIVIPITQGMKTGKSTRNKNHYFYKTGSILQPIASVKVLEPFPFDLGFAMTVHKAQGRTIKRVVIDLTDHPNHYSRMEFAAVFVAMSRVCTSNHIRLLVHAPCQNHSIKNAENIYAYLTKLKASKFAQAYLHGFHQSNGLWDPDMAMQFSDNQT